MTPGTPAAEAGLRPGDLIVAVAGRPVAGAGMLQGLIETAPIGEDLTVTIERGGQRQDIVVRPQAQPVADRRDRPSPGRARCRKPADAFAGRVRGREPRRARASTPPLAGPSPGDDAPSALDPIPRTEQPAAGPVARSPQKPTRGEPSMNPAA